MTVVGKILVFLNLVFSLLVGGLVILAYSNRENWVEAHGKERDLRQAIKASRDQILEEKAKDTARLNNDIQKLDGQIQALQAQLKQSNDDKAALTRQLAAAKLNADKSDASAQSTLASEASRAAEVAGLETALTKERDKNKKLLEVFVKERRDKVRAEIEAKTTKARLIEMEEEMRRLARVLAKKTTAGADPTTATAGTARDAKNPPPEDLEGRVVTVDSESGLIEINPGSDAGLLRGHTLEVFRLGAAPRYLGRVRIEAVSPHKAVARPVKRTSFPIRVGDRVASRIANCR